MPPPVSPNTLMSHSGDVDPRLRPTQGRGSQRTTSLTFGATERVAQGMCRQESVRVPPCTCEHVQ